MFAPVLLLVGLLSTISPSFGDYGGSSYGYGYEFAFWAEKVDYVGALVKCETHQQEGWLAEPKDSALQQVIELAVYGSNYVWVGATDLSAEDNWLWLDTTEVYWDNWEKNEPNNMGDEDCMLMLNTGEWNDKDCCYKPDGYVCQSYDTTTYEFSHSEFEIIQTPTTFWQAKEVCAANGARLTEITDPKSENRLRKVVKFDTQQLWLSRIENGVSKCATMSVAGTKEEDCATMKPAALCEKVRPHALKVSQHNVVVSTETRVEVDCTAEGYPIPQTAWFKDGNELLTQTKSLGKSKLVLENAKSADVGLYICHATNDVNKDKYEVKTFMNLEVTAK